LLVISREELKIVFPHIQASAVCKNCLQDCLVLSGVKYRQHAIATIEQTDRPRQVWRKYQLADRKPAVADRESEAAGRQSVRPSGHLILGQRDESQRIQAEPRYEDLCTGIEKKLRASDYRLTASVRVFPIESLYMICCMISNLARGDGMANNAI